MRLLQTHHGLDLHGHFPSDPGIEGTLTLTDFKSAMPVNPPVAS
ncbi:hypothetical protein ACFVOK_29745 [Streptomyces sp. NPDC057798]